MSSFQLNAIPLIRSILSKKSGLLSIVAYIKAQNRYQHKSWHP